MPKHDDDDEPDTSAPYPLDRERALAPREVEPLLGVASITLHQWRVRGEGPKWFRCGSRSVRYRLGDLLDWRDARTVGAAPGLKRKAGGK